MIERRQRISTPPLPLTARYAAKGTLRRSMATLVSSGEGCEPTWLSPREQSALACLRDASRRDDWLLGRWMLKQLAMELLVTDAAFTDAAVTISENDRVAQFRRIEVLPQTIDGLPSRPLLVLDGREFAGQVSLSHAGGGVLVAMIGQIATGLGAGLNQEASVDMSMGVSVGVDLVTSIRPGPGFLRSWFTDCERDSLRIRPELAMRYWGAKEATYKALHRGERFAPTAFEVTVSADGSWWCRSRKRDTVARIQTRQVAPGTWAVLAHGHIEGHHADPPAQQITHNAISPPNKSSRTSPLNHSSFNHSLLIGIHS